MTANVQVPVRSLPVPGAVLELLKPITWFAPMWALACGVVSSGASVADRWPFLVGAILLAGPLVCGTSQAVNDWYDREVDAINEPQRPIPSGRIPGRWGLYIAVGWSLVAAAVAATLGPVVFGAGLFGLALAWAYSAPPLRLKHDGWAGVVAVGLCYESLPWFTGAAAVGGGWPRWEVTLVALLYGVGAFGIMITNDFKAVEGDRELGLRSVPVRLGIRGAVRAACILMLLPQLVVIALLASWGGTYSVVVVGTSVVLQGLLMTRLAQDPKGHAAWFNATGTTLYVLGMMVTAVALGGMTP